MNRMSSTRMATAISPVLLALVRSEFKLSWGGEHGVAHWARVRGNGLILAERTGASARVVELFAFLHDARRENECKDPKHGHRSARLVEDLGARELGLSTEETEHLAYACRHHSEGLLDADIRVQVCWDADRLDLGRVGIRPDPGRLCTPAARDRELIAWAYARSVRGHSRRRSHAYDAKAREIYNG
jgi:uncharacterized protein